MNNLRNKNLRTQWIRKQSRIGQEVIDMEREMKKMKDKGISPDFIKQKSDRLDTFLDVINFADDYINSLRQENLNLELQIVALQKLYKEVIDSNAEQMLNFLMEDTNTQVKKLTNEIKQNSIT